MKFYICYPGGEVDGVEAKQLPTSPGEMIVCKKIPVPEHIQEFWGKNHELADRLGSIELNLDRRVEDAAGA